MQSATRLTRILRLALALGGLLGTAAAQAQPAYPARAIEVVVPSSAGGGTDVMARLFADSANKRLPQPMIVINRPGASGVIGLGEVLRAKPDGYKVALLISELATIPGMKLARFTSDDFVPIAGLNAEPAVIAVKADARWTNVDALLAEARSRPAPASLPTQPARARRRC